MSTSPQQLYIREFVKQAKSQGVPINDATDLLAALRLSGGLTNGDLAKQAEAATTDPETELFHQVYIPIFLEKAAEFGVPIPDEQALHAALLIVNELQTKQAQTTPAPVQVNPLVKAAEAMKLTPTAPHPVVARAMQNPALLEAAARRAA